MYFQTLGRMCLVGPKKLGLRGEGLQHCSSSVSKVDQKNLLIQIHYIHRKGAVTKICSLVALRGLSLGPNTEVGTAEKTEEEYIYVIYTEAKYEVQCTG